MSPSCIIMDEPFVGLDPKAAHLLKGMMREVCDEGGAIFFSTHVLEVAEKLCDKVAIIKGGKLIRSGTMEEVKGDDSSGGGVPGTGGRIMLKILLKKQMAEIFRSYFYDAKKNKARSKAAVGRVYRPVCGADGGRAGRHVYAAVAVPCATPMAAARDGLAVFCADGAAGHSAWARSAACSTPIPGLYLAKDNDLLLSMPIPVRCIMARAAAERLPDGADVLGRGHPACRDRLLVRGFGQSAA